MDKDKFQYFLEFVSMRLDDPTFRDMYGSGEFERWYSDFMEILNQKHGEPYNINQENGEYYNEYE